MGIGRYVARRLLEIIPVVLCAVVINFVLIHAAPGDPAVMLAGENPDPAFMARVRQEYGLNKPVYEQLVIYLQNVFTGNLGVSYVYHRPVIDVIAEKVPATLLLVATSSVLCVIIGTVMGAFAARKYLSKSDRSMSIIAMILYSVPIFWFAILLIIGFALDLKWFPATGMLTVTAESKQGLNYVLDVLWHLTLPLSCLTVLSYGQYFFISRTSIVEVMREDYVTTARATGFRENKVFMKYVLRNAILPVVTLSALQMGYVFAGAVLTETVFNWPGLGRLILDAVLQRDYPIVMGVYLVISILVAAATLICDLAYAAIDPRVVYT